MGRATQTDRPARSVPINEFLASEIDRQGYSKTDFAETLDVSRSTLYNALNGSKKISRVLAKKLASVLGHSHDFWLRDSVMTGSSGAQPSNVVPFSDSPGLVSPGEGNAPQLLTDAMTRSAIAKGSISISNYRSTNQKPASYDLTLGAITKSLSPNRKGSASMENADYLLEHGEGVVVQTLEHIGLPKNYLARVGPTTHLAVMGLIVNFGLQIDPGFDGPLEVSIINMSGKPISLFVGQIIISIEVFYLPVAPERTYEPESRGESFIAEMKQRVLAEFIVKPAASGGTLIAWDDAGFEFKSELGTLDAIEEAFAALAIKLSETRPAKRLSDCIGAVASEFTPSFEEVKTAFQLEELVSAVESSPCRNIENIPHFVEGSETLRGILSQCDVSLPAFFAGVLQVQVD